MKYQPIFFILLMVLLVNRTLSQNLIFEKDIQLKYGVKDSREVLPIVVDDKRVVLVLMDYSQVTAIETNEEFEEINNLQFAKPESFYNNLLGYSIKNSDYHLFFSNTKKNQFYIQTINLSEKRSNGEISRLKLKREKYLESLSYLNKFYVFTVVKMSSVLKLYEFEGNNLKTEKEFDLSDKMFPGSTFYNLDNTLSGPTSSLSISKVDIRNPISLEIASNQNKFYYFDDKVFITIDDNIGKTQIISIDLRNYEASYEEIQNERLVCEQFMNLVSNSFLTNEVLFQVKACKSALAVRVKDLRTKELISEYIATNREEIAFKNGSLRQEGGTNNYLQETDMELESTKQVLRKISKSKIGISAFKEKDWVTLTIGGYHETQGGGGGMTYTPGSNLSTPYGNVSTPGTYSYNPTAYGYARYKNKRSVHFKSLLSPDTYEHVEGGLSENPFDKIRDFESSDSGKKSVETIFRLGDYYIFGHYSKAEKTYSLYEFSDSND